MRTSRLITDSIPFKRDFYILLNNVLIDLRRPELLACYYCDIENNDCTVPTPLCTEHVIVLLFYYYHHLYDIIIIIIRRVPRIVCGCARGAQIVIIIVKYIVLLK